LPESLAEFPYDDVAPVSTAALEAARAAPLRPPAQVLNAARAKKAGLLLHVPFENPASAAYARGEWPISCEGAEYLPGFAGKGMYLPTLPGNTCNVAWPGNLNPDAGTFTAHIKPLVPWNNETVGTQNYQFLLLARNRHGDEIRLAYVRGAFQVVGGVAYNGPAKFIIWKPMDLHAGRWYDVCLTWSKTADKTVLYLDGEEMGRAQFSANFVAGDRISLACYGSSLQPMAVVDEMSISDRPVAPAASLRDGR